MCHLYGKFKSYVRCVLFSSYNYGPIVLKFQGREESVKANVFTGNLKLNWYCHRGGREGCVKGKTKSLSENGYFLEQNIKIKVILFKT